MAKSKPHDPVKFSAEQAAKARTIAPRTVKLPKKFIPHDGGDCPVEPDSYVELLVRTSEGIGGTSVQRAREVEWNSAKHEGGFGAIVAYRPALGEGSYFHHHDRFKIAGIA